MEHWKTIEEFPLYQVSDLGRVRNGHTERVLGLYDNGHGVLQVVLRRDGRNHARAVSKLVAESFLDGAPEEAVPMHRDGDRTNCRASNLEWKSRSFVIQWTMQSKRTIPRDNRAVRHVKTGVVYPNSLEAAKALGGLENLVILTAQALWQTSYLGSRFEFVH